MGTESFPVIYLEEVKTSFYEKNIDLINVHVYVKEVYHCELDFEDKKITFKFATKDANFLKKYVDNKKQNYIFCYVIEPRYEIECPGCSYVVKKPFIEVILQKKVPQKWNGLHKLKAPHTQQRSSPQLLGGKSTPMKSNEEKKQDAETKADRNSADNTASSASSKTEDERNIQKAAASVAVEPQPENTAGLTGLENYANNCYMNVVIQILANIKETRDYFKTDSYLKDINANNPLSSGGKVAKTFADVIKALWSVRNKAFKPVALKNIMGKRYSLFVGWQQHDAQEFFASLLDNLHEDLNQSYTEKGAERESKPELESSVNEKPDTAWAAHLKRNNSFIVKLFHGQLMSKLTCAACHKVSYSYDPCASISLPIPTTKHNLNVLFFTRDMHKPPVLTTLQISTPNAKVWHLINMLQPLVKVPSHLITVFNGIYSVCVDAQAPLLSVHKYKYVIANEISSKDETDFLSIPVFQCVLNSGLFVHCDNCFSPQSSTVKLKRCTRCYVVAYCSRDCQSRHWNIHNKTCSKDLKMQVGIPFYISIRKESLTFDSLMEALRDRAKYSVELLCNGEENVNNPADDLDRSKQVQKLSISSAAVCVVKGSNKPVQDDGCVVINNENFSVDLLSKTPYLIMEWQNSPDDGDISANVKTKSIPCHEVLRYESQTGMTEEENCSVHDCLRLFMEPESLDEKDSWKCPKCKTHQSAKKEMALSSPPGVLLLHLKRFTYGDFGQKINKAVSYPLSNFDLNPFVAKETRSKLEHPLMYDLCGVITHTGSMRMGHYTCIVRMLGGHGQEEIGWRYFDDDSVRKIKSDKVISPDAYVLVYRLQGAHQFLKLSSTDNLLKKRSADVSASNPNVDKLGKTDSFDHINHILEQECNKEEFDSKCEMNFNTPGTSGICETISDALDSGNLCKEDSTTNDQSVLGTFLPEIQTDQTVYMGCNDEHVDKIESNFDILPDFKDLNLDYGNSISNEMDQTVEVFNTSSIANEHQYLPKDIADITENDLD